MSSRRVAHDEIVRLIKQSNLEFGNSTEELINNHSNKSELYCYIIKYPYGSKIIDSKGLRLPDNIAENLKCDILKDTSKSSNNIPFGVILENNAEVFLNNKLGIAKSLAILREREPIGSYEAVNFMQNLSYDKSTVNYRPLWEVVAGARSIFLPALFNSAQVRNDLDNLLISNNLNGLEYYKRMFPSFDEDIFPFVRDIVNSKSFGINDWNTTLIIFPDKWLETVSTGITTFHQYIYNAAWSQSANFRNKEALTSQISEYLQHYQGTQAHTFGMEVLLDLFEIGLGHQHSYQTVQEDSSRLNGPFSEFIKILQGKLDMDRHPLLMFEPTYVQSEAKKLEKSISFYSATSFGKPLSNLGTTVKSPLNLSTILFTPMNKVFQNPNFFKNLEDIYGRKVNFQLYGKTVNRKENKDGITTVSNKRGNINVFDPRKIFNDSGDKSEFVDYSHVFFRGGIQIESVA
jgi:hypothetical protein